MKHLLLFEEFNAVELKTLENWADSLFSDLGLDITFSRHFKERLNDSRGGRPIKYFELEKLIVKAYREAGYQLSSLPTSASVILKDRVSQLNIPLVMEPGRELVFKTIMRKSNFKSTNPEILI